MKSELGGGRNGVADLNFAGICLICIYNWQCNTLSFRMWHYALVPML